jgi:putative MATE family efflux protein
VRLGAQWFRIVAPSFIFSGMVVTGGAILRGAGQMRASLVAISVVNLVNVTLAWSLTRGLFGLPQLGVAGTAIGASLGQAAGGLMVLGLLLRGRGGLRVAPAHIFRLARSHVRRILRVGLPAGAEQVLLQLALINMAAIVTRLGTEAVAAHLITLRLTAFSYLPGFGFSIAATTLVGQELGARQPDRARASVQAAMWLAVLVMTIGAAIIIVWDASILSIFTNDAGVIAAGVPIMRLAAVVQPIIAAAFVYSGALRGAGDTRATMWTTVFSVWGLRVVLAYVLGTLLGLGLIGIWLAFIVDWTSRASLFWLRFRAGKWRTVQV